MTSYNESWLTGPKATKFYTRSYRPPSGTPVKAVIVFLHGFAEYVGRYEKVHSTFASKGFLVFTFDQRGWGHTVFDKTNKSPHSSYAVTGGWDQQMADICWGLEYAKHEYAEKEGVDIILMGHSMGGGEVLGFITQDPAFPERAYLKAAVACSPWITLTHEPNRLLRWAGEKLSILFPNLLFPAEVKPEDVTRDENTVKAYKNDPMVLPKASLLTLKDSLNKGEELLNTLHANWPTELPLLVTHGSGDRVTSHKSSQIFYDKVDCEKKRYKLFKGAYHEIHNDIGDVGQEWTNEILSFLEEHGSKAAIT